MRAVAVATDFVGQIQTQSTELGSRAISYGGVYDKKCNCCTEHRQTNYDNWQINKK